MKPRFVMVTLVLIVGAYIAGYWPEHEKLESAQVELQLARVDLYDAEARLRVYKLQEDLLVLMERVAEKNYGESQSLSTRLFDTIRESMVSSAPGAARNELNSALNLRDSVTAGLVKSDPATVETLREVLRHLRRAAQPPAAQTPLPEMLAPTVQPEKSTPTFQQP